MGSTTPRLQNPRVNGTAGRIGLPQFDSFTRKGATRGILHNPCYAGAFVYGRTRGGWKPDGKYTAVKLPREKWQYLIRDIHPGYISWGQFEANQKRLSENAWAFGNKRKLGPVREGSALLQGRVLCGICGEHMNVKLRNRERPNSADLRLPGSLGSFRRQGVSACIWQSSLRDRTLMLFLYNTGARVQEVANLRASDIQLDPTPRVHLHGKGDKWRICPLWAETTALLKKLLCAGSAGAHNRPVFISPRGTALTRFGIYKIVGRYTTHLLKKASDGRTADSAPPDRPAGLAH